MNKFTNQLKWLVFAFTMLCFPHFLTAQNFTVKGKITDALTGKPIESATVTPKNSKNATLTNGAGEFSISVPNGEKLSISSIGFETQSVFANKDFLSIQLSADTKQLNDVVVTALGIR
ncbi:MAG: carboxypeptidase-like regulatory domain-containing protein, partial [Ferruginibacter sp.]